MTIPLTLVATLTVKPEAVEDFIKTINDLVAPTLSEEGCIDYEFHRSNQDLNEFVLIEHWRSQRDLDAHFAQPYTAAALDRFPQLLSREMRLQFLTHLPHADSGIERDGHSIKMSAANFPAA
jgi:quinol monooxygenase YgiN